MNQTVVNNSMRIKWSVIGTGLIISHLHYLIIMYQYLISTTMLPLAHWQVDQGPSTSLLNYTKMASNFKSKVSVYKLHALNEYMYNILL